MWQGKYRSTDNTTISKERGNSYQKNEDLNKTHGSIIEMLEE